MDVEQTPATSPIMQVPLEVLLRITGFLSTVDLGSVRRSCRAIEQMLYHSFTREFFTRRQFMISNISLQALLDMSKSRMGSHIHRLQFGLHEIVEPDSDGHYYPRDMKVFSDHKELINSGRERQIIAEALKGLENLEDVVIRDFNSRTRTREGRFAEWNSYGATTLLEEYGIHTVVSLRSTGEKLFNTVLNALGDANVRPNSIEIMARRTASMCDYAFAYDPAVRPSVLPVLYNLTRLHLSITTEGIRDFNYQFDPYNIDRNRLPSNLAWFLVRTPNLKDLRLNVSNLVDMHPYVFALMTWLGEVPTSGDSEKYSTEAGLGWPAPVQLPLEDFSCSMIVPRKILFSVIEKHAPTLKSLSLWKLTLVDVSSSIGNGHWGWKRLIRQLAASQMDMGPLRKLMIGGMTQCRVRDIEKVHREHASRRHVRFANNVYQRTFAGSDWKEELSQVVDGLEYDINSSDSHDEDAINSGITYDESDSSGDSD